MAEKEDKAEEDGDKEKKMSIHKKGGKFDDNLTIYEIENAFHPRSKEEIRNELSSILDKFVDKNVDNRGSIKDPDKAADIFLELLAKYHFGEALYEELKDNKKHMIDTLREKYGVKREALRRAFRKKGAYKTRDSFYTAHRDPLVDRVDEVKKQSAQESLNVYLNDEDARDEIPEHLKTRTGKELSDSYKKVLDLETTIKLIGQYMAIDGAAEKIEKNKKAKLDLSEAQAGHPSIYEAFKDGEKYHWRYDAEAKLVDSSHRLKSKNEKDKILKEHYTPDTKKG